MDTPPKHFLLSKQNETSPPVKCADGCHAL